VPHGTFPASLPRQPGRHVLSLKLAKPAPRTAIRENRKKEEKETNKSYVQCRLKTRVTEIVKCIMWSECWWERIRNALRWDPSSIGWESMSRKETRREPSGNYLRAVSGEDTGAVVKGYLTDFGGKWSNVEKFRRSKISSSRVQKRRLGRIGTVWDGAASAASLETSSTSTAG